MTNISSESIYALCKKQFDENISWNIVSYHIEGDASGYEYCTAEGDYRSVVYPYDNQIEFVSNVMKSVINGDIVTQEDIPEGTFNYYDNSGYYNADDSTYYENTDFNYVYADAGN